MLVYICNNERVCYIGMVIDMHKMTMSVQTLTLPASMQILRFCLEHKA